MRATSEAMNGQDTNPTKFQLLGILVACSLGLLVLNIDLFVVNVALPTIQQQLHTSLSASSWTVSIYVLMLGTLPLGMGRLGDLLGLKTLYLVGTAVFTTSSIGCGLSSSIGMLIALRAIQGVGAAMMTPATLAILTTSFPQRRRGLVLGIQGGISGLGLIAGPLLGGLLVRGEEWQWVFFINVPIGVVTTILSTKFIQSRRNSIKLSVDWIGILTLTAGLTFVMLGFSFTGGRVWAASLPFILGISLLIVFVVVESRVQDPLFDLRLIKNLPFIMGCLSYFLFSIALFGSQPYWSLFMQNFWQFTPLQSGLAFLPATIIIAGLTPISGMFAQRYEGQLRYLTLIGVILVGASFVSVMFLSTHSTYIHNLLPAFLLRGVGIPIVSSCTMFAVMNSVDGSRAGLASGSWNMSRNIGTALGVALLGKAYSSEVFSKLTHSTHIPKRSISNIAQAAEHFLVIGTHPVQVVVQQTVIEGFSRLALICALACLLGLISSSSMRNSR